MENRITTRLQVLDRAFEIINILAPEVALSVAEISRRTGLNKSTTYRFLESLIQHGYVEQKGPGLYQLGIRVVTVAGYYINKLELITCAQPLLWDLASKLSLSVFMSIQDGADIVYIARADIYRMRQIYTDIGMRVPAIATAMGKCLLAHLSGEALNLIFSKQEFKKLTQNTITDIHTIKKMLRQIKKDGYAVDNQEFLDNLRCVAAPIYDYRGEVISAICASGTCSQLPEENFEDCARVVIETANAISRTMGYVIAD